MGRSSLWVGALVVVAMGCGEEDTGEESNPQPVNTPADAAVTTPDAAALTCSEGATQSCACSTGGTGSATCVGGAWASCSGCVAAMGTESKCISGFYQGKTVGKYTSSAGLLPGVIALPEVDDKVTWNFTLTPEGTAEFTTLGNGCSHVYGEGMNAQNSDGIARTLITGSVDCATGKLTAELRGYYTGPDAILLGSKKYFYKGTVEATYDPAVKGFVMGKYDVKEPPTALGMPLGGNGTWTASLSDATPPDTSGECIPGGFPEDMFK